MLLCYTSCYYVIMLHIMHLKELLAGWDERHLMKSCFKIIRGLNSDFFNWINLDFFNRINSDFFNRLNSDLFNRINSDLCTVQWFWRKCVRKRIQEEVTKNLWKKNGKIDLKFSFYIRTGMFLGKKRVGLLARQSVPRGSSRSPKCIEKFFWTTTLGF